MRIEQITHQHRRDFTAILVCEHCGNKKIVNDGYDDDNYHQNVVPKIICLKCGEKAPETFVPLQPKYDPSFVI